MLALPPTAARLNGSRQASPIAGTAMIWRSLRACSPTMPISSTSSACGKNGEEIEKAHAYSHSTFFKNSRLSGQIAGLKFLRPDLATVHILWELVGQQDGAWHIHTAQNTDIVAALTQPAAKG